MESDMHLHAAAAGMMIDASHAASSHTIFHVDVDKYS